MRRITLRAIWLAVMVVALAGSVLPAGAAPPPSAPHRSPASSAGATPDGNPGVITAGCCEQQPPICDRGDTTVAYNDMPFGAVNCLNPAEGFECCQTNEFGDLVILAGNATNPGRSLLSLRVLFGSFACQSGHWFDSTCNSLAGSVFTHPITARLYDASNLAVPIATVTQIKTIPFRPAADPARCPIPGSGATQPNRWFNIAAPGGGACQNSISTILSFPFVGLPTLPNTVVWTVAFNTTTSGYSPIGPAPCSPTPGGCPYDSLNVGSKSYPGAPYAGVDPDEDHIIVSRGQPPSPLHPEAGWLGFRPLGEIITR